MTKKTIRVRAGEGLRVPLPRDISIDTGVTVLTPETPVEVLYNRFTRRRLQVGDFVPDGDVTEREDTPPPTEEQQLEADTVVLPPPPQSPRKRKE